MRRQRSLLAAGILVFIIAGCGGKTQEAPQMWQKTAGGGECQEKERTQEKCYSDAEDMADLYRDIYDRAAETGTLGNLEVARSIVRRIGENGGVAVDEGNQIDMEGSEQVLRFCGSVDAKEEAQLTVLVVTDSGGFIKYDFYTVDGRVEVVRDYYQYTDGILKNISTVSYPADSWQYTEEGYLLFGGSYYSDNHYVLSLSDIPEHMALRVRPLDETCRELNRRYLLPVGYGENNMFLTDWTEEDFGKLDFYDLFDRFYPRIYQRPVPYTAADDLSVGAVYRIPADIFESVIGKYIRIDSGELRQKTTYFPEDKTYEYRPRGFDEEQYPDIPYPEVISCVENRDGTMTLTVNAVYPEESTSRAFTHETVIRPLADGGFQYVSNRVIFSREGDAPWWHSRRMTEDQWKEVYEDVAVEDPPNTYTVRDFSEERRSRAVSLLGEAGYVSVAEGVNMENGDAVREFYAAYLKKQDAMVTIFEIFRDGQIGAYTFIHRDGRLENFYVQIGWQEGGIPVIISTAVSEIAQIKLTEKGYFIYAYKKQLYHSSLRQYWRVAPLSDRCRELTEKCLSGLSYINYNVLVTDWDSDNVEEILMPCMFEDLYHMDMGENLQPENGRIPAGIYERIMTTYFPVTQEQVREICGYQEADDSYPYEMIFPGQYPPFGEVVDYVENPDGTLTLYVDGVWPDYDSDCAFANVITIQPFEDGTFRYLSNSIEKKELDIPECRNRIG